MCVCVGIGCALSHSEPCVCVCAGIGCALSHSELAVCIFVCVSVCVCFCVRVFSILCHPCSLYEVDLDFRNPLVA